jgi:hypothetical protein
LGYARDPDSWDTTQTQDAGDILQSGLRNFYWPNIGDTRYAWSFLRKQGTLVTAAGTSTYILSDDFEGMLGGFSFLAGAQRRRIARADEETLLGIIGKSQLSGCPEWGGIRVVQPEEGNRGRYEVVFYPTPDAVYTLSYRYSISPPELSKLNQYHLGGTAHSECVLEACLAAAEKMLRPEQGPGVHAALFERLLQASVKIDSEMQ